MNHCYISLSISDVKRIACKSLYFTLRLGQQYYFAPGPYVHIYQSD